MAPYGGTHNLAETELLHSADVNIRMVKLEEKQDKDTSEVRVQRLNGNHGYRGQMVTTGLNTRT